MEFQFPLLPEERLGVCVSVPHLRDLLRIEARDVGLEKNCKYRVSYGTQRCIRARCIFCTASLRYRLDSSQSDNPRYILIKSTNYHKHTEPSKNATKKQQMIGFLRSLPLGVEASSMKNYATKTLGTSNFIFYQALRQLEGNQRGVGFRTILPYLQQKGYVVFEPYPVQKVLFFPDFTLFISPGMKQKYLQYGKLISIDFTYNLITEQPYMPQQNVEKLGRKKKPRQWITGIISGLDSARRLLMYGIAFVYAETGDAIEKILENFFDIMGKECQTIISDGALGIDQAIRRLQQREAFHGTHLLDAYHVMANLKVRFQNSGILRKLYLAGDEQEYYKIFESEVVYMQPAEQQKFAKFDTLSHRFCISKIPNTFVGLGSSSSMAEKINDLVKKVIPRQTPMSEVFAKLIKLSESVNESQPNIKIESYPFDEIICLPGLKDIQKTMNKHVFQRLLRQIFKATALEYDLCRQKCTQSQATRKWDCQCGFQIKTGLPCSHIIKVIFTINQPLYSQIDQYWILSGLEEQEKRRQKAKDLGRRQIRRGRPKNSRRNLK